MRWECRRCGLVSIRAQRRGALGGICRVSLATELEVASCGCWSRLAGVATALMFASACTAARAAEPMANSPLGSTFYS